MNFEEKLLQAYQKNDTRWGGLVFGTLRIEQDTLTGLLSPGSVVVSNLSLLVLDVGINTFLRKRLLAEPEEMLDESEFAG